MSRVLKLHVGHMKTGSSAIQSFFRRYAPKLSSRGIFYPMRTSDGRNVDVGPDRYKISSGNGFLLGEQLDIPDDTEILLFSHEQFFAKINENQINISNMCDKYKCSSVDILLYIRNPLEHARSTLGQILKRSMNSADFLNFAASYFYPGHVFSFLERAEKGGWRVSVRNYSRDHECLVHTAAEWLEFTSPDIDLDAEQTVRVNRSLTHAEAVLCGAILKHYPPRFLSDALIEKLPDILGESVELSVGDQRMILQNNRAMMMAVNQRVETSAAYGFETVTDTGMQQSGEIALSQEQLRTIGESVGMQLSEERAMADLEKAWGTAHLARCQSAEGLTVEFKKSLARARELFEALANRDVSPLISRRCQAGLAYVDRLWMS